ncbi:hypothetical protein JVT61DRAFT_4901 [Boletus reticuloceps]|uniref:Uncharacterized protein n=1 Tax=Boletus reticuloceps TaxID=495285 RepID=A0A8I2Z1E6_9AGAM|nr:hypothetical protein JVT61DRAFT_4901 [Boletus reticuloceps]
MSKISTKLEHLKVGDLIFADIIINPTDIADRSSKSATTSKAKQGKPVRRICLVLEPGKTSVQVTYVPTFKESTTLPSTLDKAMWYPFMPATKEGSLEPLPAMSNGKAQWASLRSKQTIAKDPISDSVPVTTVNLIKAKMKA